jgi:putative CocE/NonD family hydrolase
MTPTPQLLPTISLALSLLASSACAGVGERSISQYIAAKDGTRLAVDVHLPDSQQASPTFPALLVYTRYWRSSEHPETGEPSSGLDRLDRYFLANGYAVVKADARGSGASFGTRPTEYGKQEVRDAWDIIDWIVAQPWSDGNVGAYGTSYTGTTAELVAAVQHPALKAVIPGWSDFDDYLSPSRPYGLVASSFIRAWSDYVGWQDENNVEALGESVRRVDEDEDGGLLAAAIADHAANPDVFQVVSASEFRDDEYGGSVLFDNGPIHWLDSIEQSGVPMLVLVSWLDAGTVDGAIQRYRHLDNPQNLVIMATNHGGREHASPYVVDDSAVPPTPSLEEQFDMRLAFFDHHLKGKSTGVEAWPKVRYYNLGEETFHTSDDWPPGEVTMQRLWTDEGGSLSPERPQGDGRDIYEIDFSASTGATNRWTTQMGGPVYGLSNRGVMDRRMLTYTSAPLESDLQITGAPVVTLQLASTHTDGAFLAYLEDVDPDGRSRYVTEGGLRAIHRKPWIDPRFGDDGPLHSFRRADAMPLVPGEVAEIRFRMWPTSALVGEGHRIRLAIAGADADTFDRLPAEGDVTLTVHRGRERSSFIDLPTLTPEGGATAD